MKNAYKLLMLCTLAVYTSAAPRQQYGPLLSVVGKHYMPPQQPASAKINNLLEEIKKVMMPSTAKRDTHQSSSFSSILTRPHLADATTTKSNKNDLVCTLCKSLVLTVKYELLVGETYDDLINAIGLLMCDYFQVFSKEICSQYLQLIAPPVVHILNNTDLNEDVVCGLAISDTCAVELPPDLLWQVDIPATTTALPVKSAAAYPEGGKKVLKILQLTDTHVDEQYLEGGVDECSEPVCCRDAPTNDSDGSSIAGKYGGWKCDIPERTLDSLLEFVTNNISDIDHVIWTGDIPAHDLWSQTKETNLVTINKTMMKLSQYFPGEGVVLPSIGNHEPVPGNLLPTPKESTGEWSTDWLYDTLSDQWTANWLPENVSTTVKLGAFYKMQYRPGLTVVSINSIYCYTLNWWLLLDSRDPGDELVWLIEALSEAELAGDKVHIIGHVPPSSNECLQQWRINYYNIIDRFKDTVTGQFFGHTHFDEFALTPSSDSTQRSSGVIYMGGSATTYTYLNPGFRIYYIDGDYQGTTRKVLDYESWIMDLQESNRQERPIWRKMYTAKDAFEMDSMEPAEWARVYEKLVTDEDFLRQYHRYYWKDSPMRPNCDAACRENYLCSITKCD